MYQDVFIAIIAGLGGMLGWGFTDFFIKKTVDRVGHMVSLVWSYSFGSALFIVLAIVRYLAYGQSVMVPKEASVWLGLLFFGILQAAVYFFVYKGFEKGQITLLSPILASFSAIAALFSIVVFGELVTGNMVLALITIFAGVLLINVDINAFRSQKISFV